MKALVIVDIQNDFLPGGALPVKEGNLVIPFINAKQKEFDLVVATLDWHPKGHCSFASWPDHCIQGTWGSELAKELDKGRIAKLFYKGSDPDVDSYSAFFDNAHVCSTGLFEYLKERGINEIAIVGLATDFCVKYSVLDARELGLDVTVFVEGCRGIDLHAGDCEKALGMMERAGAHVVRG